MRRKKLLLITLFVLFFIGCDSYYIICSLNPFYIEKNIILETQIEGSWTVKPVPALNDSSSTSVWGLADTTSLWRIKKAITKYVVKDKQGADSTTYKPERYYIAKLVLPADSTGYEFKVVLFRVKNKLYADFIPHNKEALMKSKLVAYGLFETHTLARMIFTDNQMQLSWLGADCMKEMIEDKRVRVNYQWVKEAGRFVLTASSKELTTMIERYADQPRFIDWEKQKAKLELNRIN